MKRKIAVSVVLLALVMAAALIGSARQQQLEPQDATGLPAVPWKRGLAIAPVPLNMDGKNRKDVGAGSYLVNAVAGCSDCHTHPPFMPGGDPFRGQTAQINTTNYLAGGTAFGPFTSRNLTPEQAEFHLTPHETKLLRMLVEGHNYKTVGVELGVTINTVSFHMRHIYEKLQVHSKSEAVSKALRQRLV